MKVIDSIRLRCLSHATEDLDKVKKAMEFVTGQSEFEVAKATGYYGNKIIILSVNITRNREIRTFWKRMKDFGIVDEIINELDQLINDDGYLHLRFSKEEAYIGRLAIANGGDTIALRMKIISYPWKKEMGIKNLVDFFNSML